MTDLWLGIDERNLELYLGVTTKGFNPPVFAQHH
jgi:hypothetical protein